jgi:hypothetical protein
LHLAHPNKRIFIAKHDCSDACRRMAHSATAGAQSIAALHRHQVNIWRNIKSTVLVPLVLNGDGPGK